MFFTNLQNNELGLYHKIIFAQDMSLSLTDILNSDLFKVVSHNGVYKIFPLFYCKNISCNNSDVKILENKCIITPSINDLFFNFTVDNTDIVIFEDVDLAYKDISDELSTSEFNNYIQLLRSNIEFKDNIHINNGLIEGTYADYMFQLQDVTVVDNGILITQETLDSNATVRLVDPVFTNSSYQLKIDVFSVSDVNILSESNNNNIVTDTLLIDLEEYADVVIPLIGLDFNMIVGFDASIVIKHDKPIILLNKKLELSVSEGPHYVGDQLTVSALYKENNIATGAGFEVSFYNKTNLLDSENTNSNSVASYDYIPQSTGLFLFNAKILNENVSSNNLSINVVKKPTVLTLESDKSMVPPNGGLVVSGTLKYGDSALANKTVSLVTSEGDRYNLITDNNGVFSKDMAFDTRSTVVITAKFDGDANYAQSSSEFISVEITKYSSNITCSVSSTNVAVHSNVTISGRLTCNDRVLRSKTIKIFNGTTLLRTVTTNANGNYSFSQNLNCRGTWNIHAEFEEDEEYFACSSSNTNISVNGNASSFNASLSATTVNAGDGVTVSGTFLPNTRFNLELSFEDNPQNQGGISTPIFSDSNGNFSYTFIPAFSVERTWLRFYGDCTYNPVSVNLGTITVE